jgi:hypothetical protein
MLQYWKEIVGIIAALAGAGLVIKIVVMRQGSSGSTKVTQSRNVVGGNQAGRDINTNG